MGNQTEYNRKVESMRQREYPMLKDAVYLDHSGTTLYAKSLVERFSADMIANLYGNPHSASASSHASTVRVEDTRLRVLQFFKADPEHFDVIFVANATAAIKVVMEAFRSEDGFTYIYHKDSHTSVVGVRELATVNACVNDAAVECWLSTGRKFFGGEHSFNPSLFAYPAQSNLNGRRLPMSWPQRVREGQTVEKQGTYTLLDASAYVSTSQLDLSDPNAAADFTVLSFYKIFGFPDLGALIVRKDSGAILRRRKYFGGGTVDMVIAIKEQWHAMKTETLHDTLEDGTLPFHSIIALENAMNVHKKLYGSMDRIAKHTAFLAKKLYDGLQSLQHSNGKHVCIMHSCGFAYENFTRVQGPVVTFNLCDRSGAFVSNSEIMKAASIRKFHIRTGGLCNPGGIASFLYFNPSEMRGNYSKGFRCGGKDDIFSGKITGVVRASLGAMNTLSDVESFVAFIKEFYVEDYDFDSGDTSPDQATEHHAENHRNCNTCVLQ